MLPSLVHAQFERIQVLGKLHPDFSLTLQDPTRTGGGVAERTYMILTSVAVMSLSNPCCDTNSFTVST